MDALIPRIINRSCGGWLAVSPRDYPLQIGVTGRTEDDALAAWKRSAAEWAALLGASDGSPSSAADATLN